MTNPTSSRSTRTSTSNIYTNHNHYVHSNDTQKLKLNRNLFAFVWHSHAHAQCAHTSPSFLYILLAEIRTISYINVVRIIWLEVITEWMCNVQHIVHRWWIFGIVQNGSHFPSNFPFSAKYLCGIRTWLVTPPNCKSNSNYSIIITGTFKVQNSHLIVSMYSH